MDATDAFLHSLPEHSHLPDHLLLDMVLARTWRAPRRGKAAQRVLQRLGSLRQLAIATPHELVEVAGLDPSRAVRLAAGFALAQRAGTLRELPEMLSSSHVFQALRPYAEGLRQEVFWAVALDGRGQLLGIFEVARGSLLRVEVHPREVFRPLLRCAAAAAVVAHNHPSGDPAPSPDDLDLTRRLVQASHVVGVPLVDHVVLGHGKYVSIMEQFASIFDDPDEPELELFSAG